MSDIPKTMADILAEQAKVPRLRPAPADMMGHAAHAAAKDWGTSPTLAELAAANYRTKDAERRAEQAERERDEAVKALETAIEDIESLMEPDPRGEPSAIYFNRGVKHSLAIVRAAATVKRGEERA